MVTELYWSLLALSAAQLLEWQQSCVVLPAWSAWLVSLLPRAESKALGTFCEC